MFPSLKSKAKQSRSSNIHIRKSKMYARRNAVAFDQNISNTTKTTVVNGLTPHPLALDSNLSM